jgi:signal transduction histidine kinase/ActR/RegA family two-component response regulator
MSLLCNGIGLDDDKAPLIRRLTEANAEAAELVAELEESKHHLELCNRNLAGANARSAELLAELQERREELEWANANLKESFDENKRLLGIAAHDIRSGVGAISATAEILCNSIGRNAGHSYSEAELIRKESRRLLIFLEGLLDKSCADLGQIKIRPARIDMTAIANDSRHVHESLAALKSQTIQVKNESGIPSAFADPIRARQVVDNLLSNAIKFSPPRALITIEIRTLDNFVEVAVIDEGPGLTAADLKKVFCEFAQLSAKPTANEQSHGLGLSIVKSIIMLHGGSVWAENRPDGCGARFCFTFPVPAVCTRTCQILAVDDQELNRRLIKTLIERSGHSVETCNSGLEAVETINKQSFDMVFMDVEMPGLSGLEAATRIRETGWDKDTLPIVAVTGHADAIHHRLCVECGMNDVVQKPIDKETLDHMIAKWLPKTPGIN